MGRDTLWHLARTWYDGRLDRGYQRREPADAVAYLRSVGLAGPLGAVMTGRAHRRG